MRLLVALLAAFGCLMAAVDVWAASFQGLGDLPGGNYLSTAYAISADGTTIVGSSSTGRYASEPFRWTLSQGMRSLGSLSGQTFGGTACGISADGKVIVGQVSPPLYFFDDMESGDAFRWTETGGVVALPRLLQPYSHMNAWANDVSADGTIVVGVSRNEGFEFATCWSPQGVTQLVYEGASRVAKAVSADGNTVAGQTSNGAWRWTASEGMLGLGSFRVEDMSADGKVIVGWDGQGGLRWTQAGGRESLGFPGEARAVSADGSVVAGIDGYNHVFVWDAVHGARTLTQALGSSSSDLAG